MNILNIINPGLLTTIQDIGRYGYQEFGMPVSGAMDRLSLRNANWLVGNNLNEACLEITLLGPEIEFQCDTFIAVTGGKIKGNINDKKLKLNRTLKIEKGSVLQLKSVEKGCRSYLSVAGGFNVPEVMGSKSTYLRGKIGGLNGMQLQAGDQLELNNSCEKLKKRKIPKLLIPKFKNHYEARIIPGPEVFRFTFDGLISFLTSTYTISSLSDRMGYRLDGNKIKHTEGADMISSGISIGAIQIPGDGEPIVMMSDHQTVGGYTKIANVITVDIPFLGQLKPGDKVRFKEITLKEAQTLLVKQSKKYNKLYGLKT